MQKPKPDYLQKWKQKAQEQARFLLSKLEHRSSPLAEQSKKYLLAVINDKPLSPKESRDSLMNQSRESENQQARRRQETEDFENTYENYEGDDDDTVVMGQDKQEDEERKKADFDQQPADRDRDHNDREERLASVARPNRIAESEEFTEKAQLDWEKTSQEKDLAQKDLNILVRSAEESQNVIPDLSDAHASLRLAHTLT